MSPRVQGPSGMQAPRSHCKKTMFGQVSRSPRSRIGGQVKDHGSTEVTTIESYDLVSAVELNMDRTMSRDDEEHEGVNQRGKRDAKGVRNRLKRGGGNALNSSQGIAANRANPYVCKESQMFELVQFFDISNAQQAPKTTEISGVATDNGQEDEEEDGEEESFEES